MSEESTHIEISKQKHSPIGASSAYRWIACPGSVRLSKNLPNKSSFYAREGIAAHKVAEECLLTGALPETFQGRIVQVEDSQVTVNEEMVDVVGIYRDTINDDRQDGDEVAVEQRFDLSSFFPELFGTNDCSLYRSATGELFVYDLKYGRGIPVNVKRNPQLLYYGLGAAIVKPERSLTSLELVVIQPRCPHHDGPVRRYRIDAVDLLEWSVELVAAAEATTKVDAPLNLGTHCEFCPAAAICPSLWKHVQVTAKAEFDSNGEVTVPNPESISGEDLANILRESTIIDAWLRRVKEFAHHEAEAGRVPPGFKLVAKRANRKWRDETEAERALKSMRLVKAETHVIKFKTPTQIEKILKAKKAPDTRMKRFNTLIVKESSGSTLVDGSDSRPPLRPHAQEEFQAVD